MMLSQIETLHCQERELKHKGKSMIHILYIQYSVWKKKHVSGCSDEKQWKNQAYACSLIYAWLNVFLS